MNLLFLLGEHRGRAALIVLLLAAVALAVVGLDRWRATDHSVTAPRSVTGARPAQPAATVPATPAANPAEAEATAVTFCGQYFASSWQETATQEQARVAPYLTSRALSGWRAQVTPAEVASHQTARVTSCSASNEGPAAGSDLGFFLNANVVTTSTGGTQTRIAAAEIFLVPQAGAWKVDQVRA